MEYYKSIQAAVDYIEKHLNEPMKIGEIAGAASFSAFHFQRMFLAITGFTVQEYVRTRRLSEAAEQLAYSSGSILELAVAWGYQSQEAFTRAFEAYFGLPPGRYRKEGSPIPHRPRLNLLEYRQKEGTETKIDKPKLVEREPLDIVGFAYSTNLAEGRHYGDIAGFYREFGERGRYLGIPHRAAPDMAYGVSCEFQEDGDFIFIVGETVSKPPLEEGLKQGFRFIRIPGGRYAEFKAYGPAHVTPDIRRYIYGVWLPNSKYERREGPDFEVTDVMNSSYPDDLRIKIYIPLA